MKAPYHDIRYLPSRATCPVTIQYHEVG